MEEEQPRSRKKSVSVDFEHYQIRKKVNLSELYVLSFLQKKNVWIKIKKYSKTHPD